MSPNNKLEQIDKIVGSFNSFAGKEVLKESDATNMKNQIANQISKQMIKSHSTVNTELN